MMSFFDKINDTLIEYKINKIYSKRFSQYKNSPSGVFWKNKFTQNYRFELILKEILKSNSLNNCIIADIGCGYGEFFEFLKKKIDFQKIYYHGYDINTDFIKFCNEKYMTKNLKFFKSSSPFHFVDYSVMSGTFNLCVIENLIFWEKYIIDNLKRIWKKTKKIMIFYLLIKNKRMISNKLYYSEKNWIKNVCEQKFNKTKIIEDTLLPEDLLIVIYK